MATDYASMIPKEDLASFQKANPGLTFDAQEYAHYNNSTINSQNLAQGASVKIPTYQPAPVDHSMATSAIASVAGQYEALNKQQEQAQAEQKAQAESQLSLQNALLGKTADTQAFQEQAGVNTARASQDQYTQQIFDLNAQASALQKEAEAAKQNAIKEGRQFGSVQSFVTSQQNEIERNRAIKALEISANADIAQASLLGSQLKLQSAKDKAQQMVDLKYKPLEDALAIKKQQYDLNKDILSQIDKKRTEALNVAIKKEERDLEEKKNNEKGISDLVTNAAGQGAPADLRARAAKAKTPMEAANILGVYAGDYLKNEKMRAEINKIKSETVKIDNQSSLLKAQPTGIVTAPNGDAIGIPNETLASIGKLKLNEGQANAVAFVSRMIQSSKAIDSQLGKIKPTGGFYETEGYDPTSVGSGFGRKFGSDQSRVYDTNAKDFIRAKLRKESGATITDEEMEADAQIYVPRGMGLDEKDLLLAQTKRDEAIKSMIAQAGPAAPYLQQYYEQSKSKGYEYDPYLDGTVLPSIQKASSSAGSSSAYANSLLGN